MKISIKKVLNHLSLFLLINTFLAVFLAALIVEQKFSYKKIDNLNEQRKLINSLRNIPKKDIEYALLQFNGKSNLLLIKIDNLKELYKYDLIGQYILKNSKEYLNDLEKLKQETKRFNQSAKKFYISNKKDINKNKLSLQQEFYKINYLLDQLFIKNVRYNQQKTDIIFDVTVILILSLVLSTFWYRNKLKHILSDIEFLSSVGSKKAKDYKPVTLEADAILMKMSKKRSPATVDSNYLDPVTNILNNKGLYVMYAQRKSLKNQQFTSVTVFEIDNFSKKNKNYPQELIQAILKKIAYTLSLYEQISDVMARTDFNQFTMVISRTTKDQCFKDIETIKQTINELKFKLPNGKITNITISGGFVIKPTNKSLDEAISQAKQLMTFAKANKDGNFIAQTTDMNYLDDD